MINIKACHQYSDFSIDVDLALPQQGVTVIWGESGSGKTTLLRLISGLEVNKNSKISFGDQDWQSSNILVPVHKRPLGYVFQQPSLFEHLTVKGNLDYASKRANKLGRASNLYNEDSVLSLLGIEHLLNRYVSELSGGEQQRVAIARTLLIRPEILLMDEPLASLDFQRKNDVLPYIERITRELNIPVVYVTHDVQEAMKLADHMVILKSGKVEKQGSAVELINGSILPQQGTEHQGVVIEASVAEIESKWGLARISQQAGGVSLLVPDQQYQLGQTLRVMIQARDVSLSLTPHSDTSIQNIISGAIESIIEMPDAHYALVSVKCGQNLLMAKITLKSLQQLNLNISQLVWLQVKSVAVL